MLDVLLKPNPSNPRIIKKDQFEKLKKSIASFTKMLEIRPIAYDEDGVIWGGNMRYQALKALDIEMKPGSTLIACEQLNRTCYMMELDPKYCDVIRKRYAKFIGKEEEWEQITRAL